MMRFRALFGWVILLLCVTLAACTGFSSRVRQFTYPPDFTYITEEQLHTAMGQLAKSIRELQILMQDRQSIDAARRQQVITVLEAMEQAASELKTGGRSSNHPEIDAHLGALRQDIAFARAAVIKDPPNYFLVGSVTGACVYCHRGNPGRN